MATIFREGKERTLGRVVGGFGWSEERPGFLVVVGEEEAPQIGASIEWHYHVLTAYTESNNDLLMRQALDLTRVHGFEDWFGAENTMLQDRWNRRVREHGLPPFYIRYAPYTERSTLDWALSIVRSLTSPGHKRLWGLSHSLLAPPLGQIAQGAPPSRTEVPALAALGAAVGALEAYENADEFYESAPVEATGRNRVTGY